MRTVLKACLAVLVFMSILAPVDAVAGERVTLGVGRLFTNDALGDWQDRWRSGAYAISVMRGDEAIQGRPDAPGALMEYRFSNRILAPSNTVDPDPDDRRYAGILTAGAFTHFARSGTEFSLGAELVAVGPATGVFAFHKTAHEIMGLSVPSDAVEAAQFPNAVYPALSVEMARPVAVGDGMVLRPFVQARYGDETYGRLGADLLLGSYFLDGVTVRDETTGQLYQTLERSTATGYSFLLGADVTSVQESTWLPEPDYALESFYLRARAGAQYQMGSFGVFYGLTWTGPEFVAQDEGQILGSLQLQYRF